MRQREKKSDEATVTLKPAGEETARKRWGGDASVRTNYRTIGGAK